MTFLKTDDLAAYAADARKKVEAKAGGDYFDYYLKGRDLPGADQLNDPAVRDELARCG